MTLISDDSEDSKDSDDSSDFVLCDVVSGVLSLSGCLCLSVVSHARGREFREFKEYRGV